MDRQTLELNGGLFEAMISRLLQKTFPDYYTLLNKELFSYRINNTTQIDVIFVTPKLVFVIEAKNWVDWVRGTYDDAQWVGKSRSKNIMHVVSPFRQNLMHIRTLYCSALKAGVQLPPMVNLICFPDTTRIESNCREICKYSQLTSLISVLLSKPMKEYNTIETVKAIKSLK